MRCYQSMNKSLRGIRVLGLLGLLLCLILIALNIGAMFSRQRDCFGLFEDGSYKPETSSSQGMWQPNLCALRYRSQNESVACINQLAKKIKNKPFVIFAGDSRIRQLRDELVLQLTGKDYDHMANPNATFDATVYKKHESHGEFYETAGIHIRFEWIPYLDAGKGAMTEFIDKTNLAASQPILLVMGAGIWSVRSCHYANRSQSDCVLEYKSDFLRLLPKLKQLSKTTNILWVPQGVIDVVKLRHPNDIHAGFNNENMELYNNAIIEVLESVHVDGITYWHSFWKAGLEINDGLDGLHLGIKNKYHDLQMILHWVCSAAERAPLHFQPGLSYGSFRKSYCCENVL